MNRALNLTLLTLLLSIGSARVYAEEHDAHAHEHTSITPASAAAAGIRTEVATAATVRESLVLHGIVVPDPARVFQLRARYPGFVKEVRKRLGEAVAAGDVVLIVEANDSLQRYNVTAPSAGVVVHRDVNPGMVANDQTLVTVADLTTVWVELAAFQHDLDRIAAGQSVTVSDVDGHQTADGVVDSLAPVGAPASQSMTVRVVVDNADGRWRPGLFVTGELVVAQNNVPIAVRRSALQTLDDSTVVFEQIGSDYEARPVTLGRGDDDWVEVAAGLEAGAHYVTQGSYLIKADIEKSGASHDH